MLFRYATDPEPSLLCFAQFARAVTALMKLVCERGTDFTTQPPTVPKLITYQQRVLKLGRCFAPSGPK